LLARSGVPTPGGVRGRAMIDDRTDTICHRDRHRQTAEPVPFCLSLWPVPMSPVQCPEAVEAPMPVSERTCWARKPPRSFAAWLLRSRIEHNQMPTTPIVIENSAGEV
jgi:hypothetical protein